MAVYTANEKGCDGNGRVSVLMGLRFETKRFRHMEEHRKHARESGIEDRFNTSGFEGGKRDGCTRDSGIWFGL